MIPCRNMYQKGLECRVNIVFRLNLSVVFHSRLFGYVLFFFCCCSAFVLSKAAACNYLSLSETHLYKMNTGLYTIL